MSSILKTDANDSHSTYKANKGLHDKTHIFPLICMQRVILSDQCMVATDDSVADLRFCG